MDPLLTADRVPPAKKRGDTPRWVVKYDGQVIGWIDERKIGHRRQRPFYEAFVIVEGTTISLQLSAEFDERCETVLQVWRDPYSNIHVRDALRLPR